jgi:hypothetical protein
VTKLSILIATLGERKDRFTALVDKLVSQANDDVEIIAYFNNGELPLGDIRQALVDEAVGQYVCFIDDDDVLVVDHVNNDGNVHRKTHKGKYSQYKSIIDAGYPKDYQILCCNCNWKKHVNGGTL